MTKENSPENLPEKNADTEKAEEEKNAESLPSPEELTPESDYSPFLSPEVGDAVRKTALRKLFSAAEFNITDGLDDYDEDYRNFAALGNLVTREMKFRQKTKLENRAKKMQINSAAREKAFAEVEKISVEPTSMVPLRSEGRLLIIGTTEEPLFQVLSALQKSPLQISIIRDGRGVDEEFEGLKVLYSQNLEIKISGYLGNFTVTLETPHGNMNLAQVFDSKRKVFDLILDLSAPSLYGAESEPLGYFAPQGNPERLREVLESLPEQIGEFEKPLFVQYNPAVCAHNRNGQSGCQRCLESCPTLAITSKPEGSVRGKAIEIDNFLCQGGGVCATVCPTGAIRYVFPRPEDLLNRLRILLKTYCESGGSEACLLFYGETAGAERVQDISDALPGNVLAVEVEEVGSLGLEIWFSALAFGARKVLLLDSNLLPSGIQNEVQSQVGIARQILQGLHFPENSVSWVGREMELSEVLLSETVGMPEVAAATFFGLNEKRRALFYALDHLYKSAPEAAEIIDLPPEASFGEVQINTEACTLCMSCASICPTSALSSGGEHPRLNFRESLCVQCKLCQAACPEKAVMLYPRLQLSPEQRKEQTILYEEEAFCCLKCGKAFATPSVIERVIGRLRGNPQFADPEALKRLKMCEDCRVTDMFE